MLLVALCLLVTGCSSTTERPCTGGADCGCGARLDAARSPDAALPPDSGTPKAQPLLPPWQDDPCLEQASHPPGYASTIKKWTDQDALSKPPAGDLLVVGSSSIRYWKRLLQDFSAWKVIQRGYGGSLIWDTVGHAAKIVLPYKPRAVLITRYTVSNGSGHASKTLRTGGNNIGSDGVHDGNDNTIVTFSSLQPDAWGKLHLTMQVETGTYAYLSLFELSVE